MGLEQNLIRDDKATDFFDGPSIKVDIPDWQLFFFKLYFRHLVKIYRQLNDFSTDHQFESVIIKWLDNFLENPILIWPILRLITSFGQYCNLNHRDFARDYLKLG